MDTKTLPRIEKIKVELPTTLQIKWKKGGSTSVDLAGWVSTGGDALAQLKDQDIFAEAKVGNYGSAVVWDDDDLAIDAYHLKQLSDEQKPFESEEAKSWQALVRLSNNETADLLGISLSTWNAYKAGSSPIPLAIAMLCRAIVRDPILMQAHFRPRSAGRPKGQRNTA